MTTMQSQDLADPVQSGCALLKSDRMGQAPSRRRLLNWAFGVCNVTRVFAYAPTMWAIHRSADSSQHSLLTWLIFAGANLTMGLWLYENNSRHFNCAIVMNMCNACMCVATCVLILVYR
ncbi:MAG: hypothetical protein ABI981_08570 [Betaproteobacteria bacterium]